MGVNKLLLQKNKTEDDDGSEYLDTFGLVNHIFNFFEKTNEKKSRKKNLGAPTPPEDEAICLFAGLLANPDMPLSLALPCPSPFFLLLKINTQTLK